MDGATLTVSVAAELVTLPQALVTTQSYDAASAATTAAMVKEAEVAPLMLTPALRHWKVGSGVPVAATVKVTEAPAHSTRDTGWVVMTGEVLTVRVAAEVVTLPQGLETTQSKEPAVPAETDEKERVAATAPLMFEPLRRHWYVGAGVLVAATVKETAVPTQATRETGCVVMVGSAPSVKEAAVLVTLPQSLVTTQS
jgi:hypothetical protein